MNTYPGQEPALRGITIGSTDAGVGGRAGGIVSACHIHLDIAEAALRQVRLVQPRFGGDTGDTTPFPGGDVFVVKLREQ